MNVIDSMVINDFETQVISTHHRGGDWFVNWNCEIYRIGKAYGSVINRYICYLQFAIIGFWKLLKFKPGSILLYETYSIIPVYLYLLISPQTPLFIHYHEFESKAEKQSSSVYSKFLYYLELHLFAKATWVSHTNEDRISKFQSDNKMLIPRSIRNFPNYPSSEFYKNLNLTKEVKSPDQTISIVQVGALGSGGTYIKEFCQWIELQNGKYKFSIYSQFIDPAIERYFKINEFKHIELCGSIPYFQLPDVLGKYDVGVVLYKGDLMNVIYCIPNKVNEYLACGLNVWYSDVLISTHKFAEENPQYPLYSVDFSKGKDLLAPEYSSEPFEFKHWHEDAVKPLIDSIKQAMDDSLNTF